MNSSAFPDTHTSSPGNFNRTEKYHLYKSHVFHKNPKSEGIFCTINSSYLLIMCAVLAQAEEGVTHANYVLEAGGRQLPLTYILQDC